MGDIPNCTTWGYWTPIVLVLPNGKRAAGHELIVAGEGGLQVVNGHVHARGQILQRVGLHVHVLVPAWANHAQLVHGCIGEGHKMAEAAGAQMASTVAAALMSVILPEVASSKRQPITAPSGSLMRAVARRPQRVSTPSSPSFAAAASCSPTAPSCSRRLATP